jgi:pimeloyl-ACP methyl ester carboxylesterase
MTYEGLCMKVWHALIWSLGALCAPGLSAAQSATTDAIEDARFVTLGGIEQWITIRGKNSQAPVMLWVHGGPTNVQSPFVSVYEPWTEQFTLVQWDQRGAGKTYHKNAGAPEAVSLEQIARDGIELVEYLQKRLSARKIILAGHSWGSLVGVEMVRQRPELFDAFIGAGQVNSWRDTVKWQYEYALAKARAAGDTAVVEELEKSGLPPHDDGIKYFSMRRRFSAYLPKVDSDWIAGEQNLYASEPGVTPDVLKAYAAAGAFSSARLMPVIMGTDLDANTPELSTRLCVIQGELDTFTPTPIARAFYDQVRAPKKYFGIIPGAGHFAAMTHTEEFLKEVAQCLAK